MRIRVAEFSRRVARWSAGLLLAPLGLLTFGLFFTTGGPEPHEFIPINRLGFSMAPYNGRPTDNGKPAFLGLSLSGRCFITVSPSTSDHVVGIEKEVSAKVIDTSTMQMRGSFQGGIESRWHFEISPDRESLFTGALDRLLVRHFSSSKAEITSIEVPWQKGDRNGFGANTVFAQGGRQLLIHSFNRAFHVDLIEHRTLAKFELSGPGSIFGCFFDSNNRPKVLAFTGDWEVWDLASNQMDLTLSKSLPESTNQLGSPVISQGGPGNPPVLVRLTEDSKTLFTRSLEDGRIQQTCAIPGESAIPIKLSPNGRFLICEYRRLHPLVGFMGGRFEWLDKWMRNHNFHPENRLALLDLQTDKTWRDIVGGERTAFSDAGYRLISFTDEGRYEYDLPPRWQYFTPWAWASFGAWISLAALWWKLRKRRLGVAAVA